MQEIQINFVIATISGYDEFLRFTLVVKERGIEFRIYAYDPRNPKLDSVEVPLFEDTYQRFKQWLAGEGNTSTFTIGPAYANFSQQSNQPHRIKISEGRKIGVNFDIRLIHKQLQAVIEETDKLKEKLEELGGYSNLSKILSNVMNITINEPDD